jgi:glutamyl-tRNA synthetase
MSVRVRFAPSPTGHVHIGNIRAAIFNWLFARHEGGKFLLRIEDTDRERSTPEAVKAVLDAMDWLGLNFDEPPMYQSQRTAAHLAAAETLLKNGHAYKEDKGGTGKGECVMFRMPGTDMGFHDEIKGDLRKAAADLKDFVVVRSDGAPVFHLANVVDDVEMKITHIIRGDDHVENTYRHVALFRALGAEPPKYAHLPMIVNAQGKPYSKRDGAAFVGDFRERGFHADALFNYLTLLGWSPGDDREKMTRQEIVAAFTLDRVKSGPAQMDLRKLTHLNQQYLTAMPAAEFAAQARAALRGQPWEASAAEPLFGKVCALMQSRAATLQSALEWKHFFAETPDYDEKAVQKLLRPAGTKATLTTLRERLQAADFSVEAMEAAIRDTESQYGIQQGKLNQPVRAAATGSSIGASLCETLELLGRERTLKRLDYAIEHLCG